LVDLTPESRVLDIGSGWGNLATGMARVAGEVYALDTTYENLEFVAIRAAQEGLANVYPVGASATDLPFADGFFDFIVMNGVLEWVATGDTSASALDLQKQALRQAWQKLRPGGKLYVGIENRWGFMYFIGQPDPHTGLRFVTLLPRPLANLYACLLQGQPYRAWTYSRSGLEKLLRQAGFAQVEFYYPIPGYQNYRFLITFGDQNVTEFLLRGLRAFPRFSGFLYALAWTFFRLGFVLLLRQTYPSLAAIGTK
jgi:SAM-dependent methyltransferase